MLDLLTISLAVLPVLLLATCVVLWLIYTPRVARMLGECPPLFDDCLPPLTEGEDCQFATSDGLVLRGTYLRTPAPQRLGVIAFCHGLYADRRTVQRYLLGLCRDGFDVLAFDFRNHGVSDKLPGYRPVQWLTRYEVDDVRAAVGYLAGRADADPRGSALFGVSKGGAAALCAAAYDSRIRVVVTDGAYPNEAMQWHFFHRYAGILRSWAFFRGWLPKAGVGLLVMWARVLLSVRGKYRLVSAEAAARRVRQPVLMVHGERDRVIPLPVARKLRDRITGPSKLWVVPGARHNAACVEVPEEFQSRVRRFLTRHLENGHRETTNRMGRRRKLKARTSASRAPSHRPAHSTAETG